MDDAELDSALSATADPTRRALLRYVGTSASPVGRDAAAEAVGIPRATAAFHLDRLVDAGLLTTEFRRTSGRTGPGAGRPAKLYRRSDKEISLSVPERRYDLAGDVLSTAIERSIERGEDLAEAIVASAAERGRQLAQGAESFEAVLESTGYEPVEEEDASTVFYNCPFHRLATSHTATICSLNTALVRGMAEACGEDPSRVHLAPGTAGCCVRIEAAADGS